MIAFIIGTYNTLLPISTLKSRKLRDSHLLPDKHVDITTGNTLTVWEIFYLFPTENVEAIVTYCD